MKKANLLSRAEMKKVMGGYVPPPTVCSIQCSAAEPRFTYESTSPCTTIDDCVFKPVYNRMDCTLTIVSGGVDRGSCGYSYTPIYEA